MMVWSFQLCLGRTLSFQRAIAIYVCESQYGYGFHMFQKKKYSVSFGNGNIWLLRSANVTYRAQSTLHNINLSNLYEFRDMKMQL